MTRFFKFGQLLIVLTIYLWSGGLFAKTQNFKSASYKEAKQSESFIRFDMTSTKLGIITTSFDGYVKQFTLDGDLQQDSLAEGARVEFSVADLDTNTESRNEKMWNHCLDTKNHPKIHLVLNKGLPLGRETSVIPAMIFIRGYEKPLVLTGKGQKTTKGVEFDFSGDLSIKDLGIPDPSIVIASVRDNIKVTAHFIIPQ